MRTPAGAAPSLRLKSKPIPGLLLAELKSTDRDRREAALTRLAELPWAAAEITPVLAEAAKDPALKDAVEAALRKLRSY